MQQLHGFDELRNDQGIIQNRRAKIDTTPMSLYLSASSLSFRLLWLANLIEWIEYGKNRVFGRSDGGEENDIKVFPQPNKFPCKVIYMLMISL
jgi:hypothetical protein